MSKSKTDLENYLLYGIDEKNRRIYFGNSLTNDKDYYSDIGDFSQSSVEYCIRSMDRMISSSRKLPIEIHMNSYGGDPYAMLALYDAIQVAPCKIKFFGKGAIMSAATWIMCGCDERYIYPNTVIMVHNGWEFICGKHTDVRISMEESIRLQDKLEEIFAKNSIMPKSFWKEVCKRDLYLSAKETIMLGLADSIIEPTKRNHYRNLRNSNISSINKAEVEKLVKKLLGRIHSTSKFEIIFNTNFNEKSDIKNDDK